MIKFSTSNCSYASLFMLCICEFNCSSIKTKKSFNALLFSVTYTHVPHINVSSLLTFQKVLLLVNFWVEFDIVIIAPPYPVGTLFLSLLINRCRTS